MLSWLEINKANILRNLTQFRKIIGRDKLLMPVVKSNAYGHGIIEIAKLIDKSKMADKIAVANSDEALLLLQNNVHSPIFILSSWEKETIKKVAAKNIELAVYDYAQAKYLSGLRKNIKIHLKVDTGTSRLGVVEPDFIKFAKKVLALPSLRVVGVFTHYANSEEDNNFTREQTKKLKKIKKSLEKIGLRVKYYAACSAAVISSDNTHFDGLRLGISLYGYWPSLHTKIIAKKRYPWLDLKPALTWKAKIIQIKEVPPNTFIGYGGSYLTRKETRLAIIPVGYYEGYDRGLSNCGEIYLKNKRCPVIGRVCMNLTMINISKIKKVKIGDEVEIMGNHISPEEIAAKINSINYEVIARINPLVNRLYRF